MEAVERGRGFPHFRREKRRASERKVAARDYLSAPLGFLSRFEQKGHLLAGWPLKRDKRYPRAADLLRLFARRKCQYPCRARTRELVEEDAGPHIQSLRTHGSDTFSSQVSMASCSVHFEACESGQIIELFYAGLTQAHEYGWFGAVPHRGLRQRGPERRYSGSGVLKPAGYQS